MAEQGTIFDIKEFTIHDGPGIRTTVFLKGCPLRCIWCHNPEGLSSCPQLMEVGACQGCGACHVACAHPECAGLNRCAFACPQGVLRIAGEQVGADELAERLKRQASLLVDGGITLSGGEPLMQPAFALDLLERLRPLHTVVETCGHAEKQAFLAVAKTCDIVYLDIKLADAVRHRKLTGVDNTLILENLQVLASLGRPFVVRVPLIPELTDTEENLADIAQLLNGMPSLQRVELMPCNPYVAAKYVWIDMQCAFSELSIPRNSNAELAMEILGKANIQTALLT